MADGSTVLLYAAYLDSLGEQVLPLSHRGQLSPEAFLRERMSIWRGGSVWRGGGTRPCRDSLSYMWQTADHPDPEGGQLQDVTCFLCWLQSTNEYKNCTIAVFWDWASLYQDKPKGSHAEEQTLSFKSGLQSVDLRYCHTEVISLLNTLKPPGRQFGYDESGWTVSAIFAISSVSQSVSQ